jgi:hypothetical protein
MRADRERGDSDGVLLGEIDAGLADELKGHLTPLIQASNAGALTVPPKRGWNNSNLMNLLLQSGGAPEYLRNPHS